MDSTSAVILGAIITLTNSPIMIAVYSAIFMLLITILNLRYKKKSQNTKDLQLILDKKVDVQHCQKIHSDIQRFKTRMDEETDNQKKSIVRIEKYLIWLVEKQGGRPNSLMDK